MTQNIVVIGSGFAGMWAALAAARAVASAGLEGEIAVTVVSPAPTLVIRPRLYEGALDGIAPDLGPLFAATGVRHLAGMVQTIDHQCKILEIVAHNGKKVELAYDKLVPAAGSRLARPPVPGLAEHAFSVDQLDEAQTLAAHLQSLKNQPACPARDTVVVVGAGLTGLETATEMPDRLRGIFGATAAVRVVLVEQAPVVAAAMGPAARPVIETALAGCGVEVLTGVGVESIDARGVTLKNGARIEALTVVWTGGAHAAPPAAQIPGERDESGRIVADSYLRAPAVADIFVAGDMVHAAADDQGAVALMSCQHAVSLGRVAGYNAAAELIGLPLHPYSQPKYVTCLDLGPWGALYTEGWDSQVRLTGQEAKNLKRDIVTKWIYPPAAEREAAFAVANPDFVIVP
jgi:NADH:ubiquinone reductase (H+-translocating)